MPLSNCEISLQFKRFKNCILVAGSAANQRPKIEITDAKLDVPAVTLSTQDNVEVLISKALIDSNTSHNEFVLINKVENFFDDMKEEKKKSKVLLTNKILNYI